jgi:lysyl-tRNA synthetase class 2
MSPAVSVPFFRITMDEAFVRWAGFSLAESSVRGSTAMEAEARRLGLDPPAGLDTAALYDLIFIHAVEPKLPKDKSIAILDYPAFVPTLAQDAPVRREGYAVKERWELYVNGIELANCFSEETDPEKVRAFFESERAAKEKTALVRHNVDTGYWKIFAPKGAFPRCSGVAMGLDRFIMALTGKSAIDGILPLHNSTPSD